MEQAGLAQPPLSRRVMLMHMRLALSGGWVCSKSQAKAQQKSCEQRRRSERRGAQRAELRGHWGRLPCPVGAPAWVGAPSSGRHARGGPASV